MFFRREIREWQRTDNNPNDRLFSTKVKEEMVLRVGMGICTKISVKRGSYLDWNEIKEKTNTFISKFERGIPSLQSSSPKTR